MKKCVIVPLIAAALLFAGCEATLVESRPIHQRHGYVDRGYQRDEYYREDNYRQGYYRDGYQRSAPYVRRSDYYVAPSYGSTRSTTYSPARAPYRSGVAYRSSGGAVVVGNRAHVKHAEVQQAPKGKKKSNKNKKEDDRHDRR